MEYLGTGRIAGSFDGGRTVTLLLSLCETFCLDGIFAAQCLTVPESPPREFTTVEYFV